MVDLGGVDPANAIVLRQPKLRELIEALDLLDGLILVGGADKLTPPVHAHGLAARLPHSLGVTELDGLGHMTPIEDPDAVVRAVRDLATRYLTDHQTKAKEGESA